MFTKCSAIHNARPTCALSPTYSNSTIPAPIAFSKMMKTTPSIAARRTWLPREVSRQAQTPCTNTTNVASSALPRCDHSMIVLVVGSVGMISPLHIGQWLPQPAPEPVARTSAPHKITPTTIASATQL